jgi:hypothetical protein
VISLSFMRVMAAIGLVNDVEERGSDKTTEYFIILY